VQTVLRILQKKGLVEHRTEGRRLIYTACYTRCDLAEAFLREAFDGQLEELLNCLLRGEPFNSGRLAAIQRVLQRSSGQDSP
jgi:predicted transcriptional regulator